jgi:hypothetical protein
MVNSRSQVTISNVQGVDCSCNGAQEKLSRVGGIQRSLITALVAVRGAPDVPK